MYDSEGLAFTGLGITLDGLYQDMVWREATALILTAIASCCSGSDVSRVGRGQ